MGLVAWQKYRVELKVDKLLGGVPKDPALVTNWLRARMPAAAPANVISIEELAQEVVADLPMEATEDASGWTTFRVHDKELYIRGNDLRAHLKDCAQVYANMVRSDLKNFRSKFVDRCYVEEERLCLGKSQPDGTDEHPVHVMTRLGPRTGLRRSDYVEDVTLVATLRILNDGVVTEEHLKDLFTYGAVHGIGAERSMSYGRYTWTLTHIE